MRKDLVEKEKLLMDLEEELLEPVPEPVTVSVSVSAPATVAVQDDWEISPPKASWFWFKNTAGEASASLTFATITFVVIMAWLVLSILDTITVGNFQLSTRAFDPMAAAIVLGATFSLYFGRRYIDRSSQILKR